MVAKRDLATAVLLTFCLTATIFMVATSQSAEYDPWVDLNDDGKIDIFDVVGMTSRYAATGDPTKNVTVTNFPTEPAPKTIIVCQNHTVIYNSTVGSDSWLPFVAHVEEYEAVSIFVAGRMSEPTPATLLCYSSCQGIPNMSVNLANLPIPGVYWHNCGAVNLVPGAPEIRFRLILGVGSLEMTIVLYCYN